VVNTEEIEIEVEIKVVVKVEAVEEPRGENNERQ